MSSNAMSAPKQKLIDGKPPKKTLLNYFTKITKDIKKVEEIVDSTSTDKTRKRKLSNDIDSPATKIGRKSANIVERAEAAPILAVIDLEENSGDVAIDSIIETNNSFEENLRKPENKILIKLPISKSKKKKQSKSGKDGKKKDKSVDSFVDLKNIEDISIKNKDADEHMGHTESFEISKEEAPEPYELVETVIEEVEETNDEEPMVIDDDQTEAKIELPSNETPTTSRRKSNRIENSQAAAAVVDTESKADDAATTEEQDTKLDEVIEINDDTNEKQLGPNVSSNNTDENKCVTNSSKVDKINSKQLKPTSSTTKILTPKQIKYNEQRQRAREEREKKIQDEREQRQKEKKEQDLIRKKEREEKEEQKKREREEKEEQRKRERDEKEKKRLDEIQQKNDEKKKKDDERKKKEQEKEEEKRKKELEKEEERKKKDLEKEEEENKKKRVAENFKRFFRNSVDNNSSNLNNSTLSLSQLNDVDGNSIDSVTMKSSNFMPFCVKGNMKLAPTIRRTLTTDDKLKVDEIFGESYKAKKLYLDVLKNADYVAGRADKTFENIDDDVMIIDDEYDDIGDEIVESKSKPQKYRAKFLLFEGNRRPPYYGTWRKTSNLVKPRKPFTLDSKYFNYDIDSDDEWEEEEEGESLKGSDNDYESADDYEVDNEFFVPHGYLSDEENKIELEDGMEVEENDNHPDTQKAKLKILQQEFFAEHCKKTEKIKPKLIGCIWENLNGIDDKSYSSTYPKIIHKLLESHAMIMNECIVLRQNKNENPDGDSTSSPNSGTNQNTVIEFTNDELQDLIKLTHGNVHKREFLIKEFLAYRASKTKDHKEKFTKVKINNKIREIAEWKRCLNQTSSMNNKYCWIVHDEKLKELEMSDLDILNTWKYSLTPTRIGPVSNSNSTIKESELKESSRPSTPIQTTNITTGPITKYTKALSEIAVITPKENSSEEMDVTSVPLDNSSQTTPPSTKLQNKSQSSKKRVNLLSVAKGQPIPQKAKNSLISEFLKNGKINSISKEIKEKENIKNDKIGDCDDVIELN